MKYANCWGCGELTFWNEFYSSEEITMVAMGTVVAITYVALSLSQALF